MGKINQREIQYDLLRILSMLLVMLYHYTTQFDRTVQSTDFLFFFHSEWSSFAVSLFLLMVGFFSYKALNNEKLTPVHYLKKRALRLLPTFWLCLTCTTIVLNATGTNHIGIKQFLLNAFLVNRFVNVPFVDGVYWYMLILAVFTIMITVAKAVRNFNKRTVLYVSYTICFVGCGLVNRFVHSFPSIISFALFEYLNKCLIGLFIAFLYHNKKAEMKKILQGVLLTVLLTVGEFLWISNVKSVVEIASIVLFAIVVWYGNCVRADEKLEQIIRSIAGETYFIYLFHQQIGFVGHVRIMV